MMAAAKMLKEQGAKNIYIFATHGIFNTNFYERLDDSAISGAFVTNSQPAPGDGNDKGSKVHRISISKMFADHIYRNCMSAF
jgi:ribose-phosphate pyrophosphokinase